VIKKLFICLLIIFSLSGCGKSEDHLNNSKNYKDFLISEFKEAYDKEIIIESDDVRTDRTNNDVHYMNVYLKDDSNFKFEACTFWETSDAVVSTNYVWVTNYENINNKNILENNLNNLSYGSFVPASEMMYEYENCNITNYTYIFELNSLDNLDNFADVLSSINYDSSIYLTVKYNGKEVNISINKNNDKSFYLVELKKLD